MNKGALIQQRNQVCNILWQRLKVNSDLSISFVQTVEKNQIPYDPAASDATVPRGYVTLPGLSLPPPLLKVTYDLDGKINIKKERVKKISKVPEKLHVL
jgi:hypothetical protein